MRHQVRRAAEPAREVAGGPPLVAVRHRISSTWTPLEVLRALRHEPHPFCLAGSWLGGGCVLGSRPSKVLCDSADPFAALDLLDGLDIRCDEPSGVYGGWVGYLGYQAGRLVERLPAAPPRPAPLPHWWLAWYDEVLRFDEDTGWWFEALVRAGASESAEQRARRRASLLARMPSSAVRYGCSHFEPHPPADDHRKAVQRAIELIVAGDIYQANVCMRLSASLEGSLLDLFARGVEVLSPPYAAYLDLGSDREVASLSPEQFLRRRARVVETSPIKGTARRAQAPGAGEAAALRLLASAKDRAENVMIVDLMRNDLGRVCVPGTIEVPGLCELEPHPGVWHLVSRVRGVLGHQVGDGALLRAAFPPGSVTGAPKIRAMEVIAEVESTAREVYTGAIGIVSPTAGAEWSVAIRTFESAGDAVWLGVGGGIVAESDPEAELQECLDKARPLIAAVGAALGEER